LEDLFSWDPSGGVAVEFLAAFEDIPYVIADEAAFAALIDELEGLELNGAHLQGNQVVALMRTLYGNPGGSLTSQEQFLIALGAKAASDAANVDLNRLLELIPAHAFTSVPPQNLLTTYLRLQPLDPGSILVWAPDQAADSCED
jgi:anionic cell wall polymer biosynthesis LytR-Cps2A-Psr (LCP) family protein